MWLILGPALLVLFVSAYLAIPSDTFNNNFEITKPVRYGLELRSQESDLFKINILRDLNIPGRQVEVIIKDGLPYGSPTLYLAKTTNSQSTDLRLGFRIGMLGSKGTYRFNLNGPEADFDEFYISVYDKFKNELIDQLDFRMY